MKIHHTLKTAKRAMTPLSIQEMSLLLDGLDFPKTFQGMRDKLILELLYQTGMRRAELIQLQINDIDLNLKTVKVLGKRNKERLIPLTKSICDALDMYLRARRTCFTAETNQLFLNNKGNMLYPQFVYNLVRKYLTQVTTKKQIGPHILRHTFATHMLEGGANLNATKELLGHSSLAATQVYTHSNIAALKKVYQNTHPRKNRKSN
jgi:integrase/recombinase XerC